MTQESYKLDLEIEYEVRIFDKDVSVEATYSNVTIQQANEIMDVHMSQGHIIKTFQWR